MKFNKIKRVLLTAAVAASVMATSVFPAFAAESDDTSEKTTEKTTEETTENDTEESADSETITDEDLVTDADTESEGDQFLPDEVRVNDIEEDATGSITITLTDGKTGTSKSNIKFYCVKVASIEAGDYILDSAYETSGIDFSEIENSDQLDDAAATLANFGMAGDIQYTDDNGTAVFNDLEVGVYLIQAEDSENYDTISPSIIAIPTWDESEGDMMYDVSLSPKHTPKPDETTSTSTSTSSSSSAPQTNLMEYTVYYLAAAGVCVVLAGVLIITKRKKR